LGIISSDRISAFDHVLRQLIPYKGQVLNSLAAFMFERVSDLVETHVVTVPHPNLTIAKACQGLPVEVVVRGYLSGHAARVYAAGGRELCGVGLPDGLMENQKLPTPVITPTTKATEGHDEDITETQIIARGLMDAELWEDVKRVAFALFRRGTEIAAERGLILVDTKYEFGLFDGRLVLMDEVHTPDSSRYFEAEGYVDAMAGGGKPRQLSKEFVREWLIDHGFMGKEGQTMPDFPPDFVERISQRYIELYERLCGQRFIPASTADFDARCASWFAEALTDRP
jgi:phosphoribosylaminoimidazole-succinocarboxamide synthase